MRKGIPGRCWWLALLAAIPADLTLADSSAYRLTPPADRGRPKGARGAAGGKRYPGAGAFEEANPRLLPGPLRWSPRARLVPEPCFSRILIPNYALASPTPAEEARALTARLQLRRTDRWWAIERVVKTRTFREIRKHARRQWQDVYRDGAPISVFEYEERLRRIHQMGREGEVILAAEILRNGILGADEDPPGSEVEVVDWGPMGVTESGRLQLDLAETLALPREGGPVPIEIVPDEKPPRREPLFDGRGHRIRSRFRLDADEEALLRGRTGHVVDSASFAVDVQFLTPLRKTRWMDVEVEVMAKSSGRFGAFVNLTFFLP